MQLRSRVWLHFKKFLTPKGKLKTQCLRCGNEYVCDHKKKNGTASLKYHLSSCIQNPSNDDKSQAHLVLPIKGKKGEGVF